MGSRRSRYISQCVAKSMVLPKSLNKVECAIHLGIGHLIRHMLMPLLIRSYTDPHMCATQTSQTARTFMDQVRAKSMAAQVR